MSHLIVYPSGSVIRVEFHELAAVSQTAKNLWLPKQINFKNFVIGQRSALLDTAKLCHESVQVSACLSYRPAHPFEAKYKNPFSVKFSIWLSPKSPRPPHTFTLSLTSVQLGKLNLKNLPSFILTTQFVLSKIVPQNISERVVTDALSTSLIIFAATRM